MESERLVSTVAIMQPEELSQVELDMVEFVLPHMIDALNTARLAGIPWETVSKGMAMAAGIGLAQAYPEPCSGSRVAIMKARSAITAAYRVAVQDSEGDGE